MTCRSLFVGHPRTTSRHPEASKCAAENENQKQRKADPAICWVLHDLRHGSFAGDRAAYCVELPVFHIRENRQENVANKGAAKTKQHS